MAVKNVRNLKPNDALAKRDALILTLRKENAEQKDLIAKLLTEIEELKNKKPLKNIGVSKEPPKGTAAARKRKALVPEEKAIVIEGASNEEKPALDIIEESPHVSDAE